MGIVFLEHKKFYDIPTPEDTKPPKVIKTDEPLKMTEIKKDIDDIMEGGDLKKNIYKLIPRTKPKNNIKFVF